MLPCPPSRHLGTGAGAGQGHGARGRAREADRQSLERVSAAHLSEDDWSETLLREWERKLWRFAARTGRAWETRTGRSSRRAEWAHRHPAVAGIPFGSLWGGAMLLLVLLRGGWSELWIGVALLVIPSVLGGLLFGRAMRAVGQGRELLDE